MPWLNHPLRWRHNGCDSVSNHQPRECLLRRLITRTSKKTSKLRVTGLCAGNSPETGEFPAQMASNAENVSIWWRHHALKLRYGWVITSPKNMDMIYYPYPHLNYLSMKWAPGDVRKFYIRIPRISRQIRINDKPLTHSALMTYIRVCELGRHWLLMNKLQWNLHLNAKFSLQKINLKMLSAKCPFLSRA